MKKKLLFVAITVCALSLFGCADNPIFPIDTQQEALPASEISTQEEKATSKTKYVVYVYNKDGSIRESYIDVFDVSISDSGVVKLSLDENGKNTDLLVNEEVKIKKHKVICKEDSQENKENILSNKNHWQ